jgi:hypothetical protein
VRVKLTLQQRSLARAIASLRNDPKVAAGVRSRKLSGTRGELQTHIMGVESEMAVCELYGVPVDAHASLRGDAGYDLEIVGKKVEVKCRRRPGYSFAMMGMQPMTADAGVLVYEDDGDYLVHGVITRDEFIRSSRPVDYGYGPRLAVEPKEFSHWSSLVYKPGDWMCIPEQAAASLIQQGWTVEERGAWIFRRGPGEPQCVSVNVVGP